MLLRAVVQAHVSPAGRPGARYYRFLKDWREACRCGASLSTSNSLLEARDQKLALEQQLLRQIRMEIDEELVLKQDFTLPALHIDGEHRFEVLPAVAFDSL